MIYKILPSIKNYAWGSITRIPRLLGLPRHTAPIAELWYGANSRGPSIIAERSETEIKDLRQLIHAQKATVLGKKVFERYGIRLPFLLKVLSADKGLSIQAHPNKLQAQEGFARENTQKIDIQAVERNYRDTNHKPECLIALEDFWALCGFRKPEKIAQDLQKCDSIPLNRSLINILLADDKPSTTLELFYSTLMNAATHEQTRLLRTVLAYISSQKVHKGNLESQWYWVEALNRQFPSDSGALAPLYLNLWHLQREEALFMKSGILHAYLRGTGLEIMANSDNVLRGGCTEKYVDVQELLSILTFTDTPPIKLKRSNQGWYKSFVDEFEIAWMKLTPGQQLNLRTETNLRERMCIIFVLTGELSIQEENNYIFQKQGEALFMSAAEKSHSNLILKAHTSATSFALATVNV